MYIKKEDFGYLESLYKSLDEGQKKRFLDAIQKSGSERMGEDISKIEVVSDEIFDVRGIDPKEFITRTMIKKTYKTAKEGI